MNKNNHQEQKLIEFLKECLSNAEDILDQISSESNPAYLNELCWKYDNWKKVNRWRGINPEDQCPRSEDGEHDDECEACENENI